MTFNVGDRVIVLPIPARAGDPYTGLSGYFGHVAMSNGGENVRVDIVGHVWDNDRLDLVTALNPWIFDHDELEHAD